MKIYNLMPLLLVVLGHASFANSDKILKKELAASVNTKPSLLGKFNVCKEIPKYFLTKKSKLSKADVDKIDENQLLLVLEAREPDYDHSLVESDYVWRIEFTKDIISGEISNVTRKLYRERTSGGIKGDRYLLGATDCTNNITAGDDCGTSSYQPEWHACSFEWTKKLRGL